MVGDFNIVGFGGSMNKKQAAREWIIINEAHEESVFFNNLMHTYCAGWDAGQKQLLSEAAIGFEEWVKARHEKITSTVFANVDEAMANHKKIHPFEAWQASQLSAAKLLAEKDEKIKDLEIEQVRHIEILKDEFSKLLAEKDAEIERLKAVILEMSEGLGFYGNADTYDRDGLPHGFCAIFDSIKNDHERLPRVSTPNGRENLSSYGGKRARETLSKHKDLLDQLNKED